MIHAKRSTPPTLKTAPGEASETADLERELEAARAELLASPTRVRVLRVAVLENMLATLEEFLELEKLEGRPRCDCAGRYSGGHDHSADCASLEELEERESHGRRRTGGL